MKNQFYHTLIAFLFFLLTGIAAQAQIPQGVNYQAVARTADGWVLANTQINVRFTVYDGAINGEPVYQEQQQVITNQFGLFTAVIGEGDRHRETFNAIKWATGNKFLQVEVDYSNTGNFVNMGTLQMMAVPYALY